MPYMPTVNSIQLRQGRRHLWALKADPDSILILTFEDTKGGGRVSMVHANVADHDAKGVTAGWNNFYWDPWRKYLRNMVKPAKGAATKKKPAPKKEPAKKKSSR